MYEFIRNFLMYFGFISICYLICYFEKEIIKKIYEYIKKKTKYFISICIRVCKIRSIINVIVFISLLVGVYFILECFEIHKFKLIKQYSSIFGAIIGLFGITITLNFNEKQNLKNKVIEYKPYLKLGYLKYTEENINLTLHFEIKNVGRGEAKNIYIYYDSNDYPVLNREHLDIIPANESENFTLSFMTHNVNDWNEIKFTFEYENLYGFNEKMECGFCFKIISTGLDVKMTNAKYTNTR